METLLSGRMATSFNLPDSRCLSLLLTIHLLVTSVNGMCELPVKWRGGWFQSGVRDVISITRTEFSSKGACIESSTDKFLFKDRKKGCFRCVVISEKHTNVLSYKETLCESTEELSVLCDEITGDALLFSMFRRDAPPDPCPFKGPFNFSYSRGHGVCTTPASTIDSCTSESRLLFKYQACPDVHGTESSIEEVECIGQWKEGSTRYFVGRIEGRPGLSNEDRFRCFAWERAKESEAHLDYRMAQSGDATCNGVFSAYDGSKTLMIKRAGSYSGCEFPGWVTSHRHWHALDHGASYSVSHHNTTLRLHHTPPNHNHHKTQPGPREESSQDVSSQVKVVPEARIVCAIQRESTAYRAVFVTHFTTGCSSGYVCTVFYKRDGHIIEMQQGSQTPGAVDACHPMHFNASTAIHITLTSNAPSRRACPLVGVWVAGRGECGRDVTHLKAGCSNLHDLNFVNTCSKEVVKKSYICHGDWAEGESVFVVASPHDHPSRRYCIIASSRQKKAAGNKSQDSRNNPGGGKTLQITAHAHSCPRTQVPMSVSGLSINFTAQGECESSSSSSSSSNSSSSHSSTSLHQHLPHITLLLIIIFMAINRTTQVPRPR